MKLPVCLTAFLVAIVFALQGSSCWAEEDPLEFLHLLQQRGYGDMAVVYLNLLAKRAEMPTSVRDVWDLEMAKSKEAAAAEAFDSKEEKQLLAEAHQHRAKFIREKPNHPAAMKAIVSWGESSLRQAAQMIQNAQSLEATDRAQYEKTLAEARTLLNDARGRFQQAEKKFKEELAALPPPSKLPTKKADRAGVAESRAEAENNVLEAQLQLGLVEYQFAQTFSAAQKSDRTAALKKAVKAFDDVFQFSRNSPNGLTVTGLYAHMYHGKAAEELGDYRLALDIYDEVLANAPDPSEKTAPTGLEPLFSRVEYFRLLILAKQKPLQFLPEATAWLQHYKKLRSTDGYQGVALEVAKALQAKSATADGAEKARQRTEALQVLTDMVRVRSQYQQEAMAMRRKLMEAAGKTDVEASTFEEAAGQGEIALASSQWEVARDAFKKALVLAEKSNVRDSARKEAVRESLGIAQYAIARDLYSKGKFDECVAAANEIIFEDSQRTKVRKNSQAAAQAGALTVFAALNQHLKATNDAEKQKTLEKLVRAAELTENNWPDKPEADDARMARAQLKANAGHIREALEVYERVNPKSERYPPAMYAAGQGYWHLADVESDKPENARNQSQIKEDIERSVRCLEQGLAVSRKQAEKQRQAGKPVSEYFVKSQLMLAAIRLKLGEAKEAAELYQPLVDIVKAQKPQNLDTTTISIFLGAVRAYSALNDLKKAGEVSDVLMELGPDTLPINTALVEFARLLDGERKKAAATVTELESTTKTAETDAAKERLGQIEELLTRILAKLSERQQVSVAGMVFIGDTLSAMDRNTEAGQQYQKIIQRYENDPEFAQAAAKAMTRVRSQLLGVSRKEGRFEEALRQADQLIKEHPRALEPMMEKGRILEAWAERDPSRFSEAVAHWVSLRAKLQTLRKKPAEYYEVMYNVAACLVREAEASKDKAVVQDRAKKAEQVLKSALVLNPRLNGPDTVAKYKVLLNKAIKLQGRADEQKDEKKL